MERLKERLAVARRALATLEELVAIKVPSKVERDAAIQRFEYTFEAIWRTAGRFLFLVEGISAASPKGIVRSCREAGMLTEEQTVTALEMVDDRNRTVHTYNERVANQIYAHLPSYAHLLSHWLHIMEKRVAEEHEVGPEN